MTTDQTYTTQAAAAVLQAAQAEHDFGGWLAQVLAIAAAQLGSGAALTAGRPGSWEAALVDHLIRGTVGPDDEDLSYYDPHQELSQPDGPQPDA
jgi:hypothetical protein